MTLSAPPRSLESERLRKAYAAGRRAHPRIELTLAAFTEGRRQGVPLAVGDYYLARACDAGVPGAWERLQVRFQRPLRAFLRKRGASANDADQLLDEGWGALATPPPRGGAATRIGTYDGRGSLHAWLATILWRRLTERWRARSAIADASVEEGGRDEPEADPAHSASQLETGRQLSLALEEAWSGLTRRELQAVVLKYCHRLPQTEIARVMRVGPPRVTRTLQSATARLRTAIAARFDRHEDWDVGGAGWSGLAATVERMLARTAAEIDTQQPGRTANGRP